MLDVREFDYQLSSDSIAQGRCSVSVASDRLTGSI